MGTVIREIYDFVLQTVPPGQDFCAKQLAPSLKKDPRIIGGACGKLRAAGFLETTGTKDDRNLSFRHFGLPWNEKAWAEGVRARAGGRPPSESKLSTRGADRRFARAMGGRRFDEPGMVVKFKWQRRQK